MNANQIIDYITKYLELSLSENALLFFYDIKKSFGSEDELFCDFIVHYLTIQKGGVAPKQDSIYADFCRYFSQFSEIQGEEKILEQIARYAKYYLMLRLEYIDDIDLAKCISIINSYEIWDVYPFMLELMDDYEHQRIDKNSLLEMMHMVEELAYKKLQGEDVDLGSLGIDINRMLYNSYDVRNAG